MSALCHKKLRFMEEAYVVYDDGTIEVDLLPDISIPLKRDCGEGYVEPIIDAAAEELSDTEFWGDLEQDWPERRETVLGTTKGTPKAFEAPSFFRGAGVKGAATGSVAFGPETSRPMLGRIPSALTPRDMAAIEAVQ